MPQLDLFGAPYNKSSEKNPEAKEPVKNKEEKVEQIEEPANISASPLALAEGMLGGNRLKVKNEKNEIQVQAKEVVPQIVSLFDVFASSEAKIIKEEEPVILIPAEPLPPAPLSPIIELQAVEEKKSITQQIKKEIATESKRNGAVIFDDGKITVKIKNKPSVAVEPIKEKKEQLKKEPQKRGRKSFKEIDAEVDLIEIPEDEILFQKQYYPISEVAGWFKVNTSLLRFWENEFDVLTPRKNRKGDRLFKPEDVKNLQLIYHLLRQRKYTIEGAKEYLKTNKKKADLQMQLTHTLQKFKGFLLDLKANLQT